MRKFDFGVDEPQAQGPPARLSGRPDEWITPLDAAGKRCVGRDWFGPCPSVGDRVGREGDLIVVKVERFANGPCVWTRPLFAAKGSTEERVLAGRTLQRLSTFYPAFTEAYREERSKLDGTFISHAERERREGQLIARLIECDRMETLGRAADPATIDRLDFYLASVVRGQA